MSKTNGMTNRDILTELHTDMKWMKNGFHTYKKIAVNAKDRSLKNEQEIKGIKQTVAVFGTVITIFITGLSLFKDKIFTLFR